MSNRATADSQPPRYDLTTDELGAEIRAKAASIRVRLCRTGSYYGLIPTKLPNGRLLWPHNSRERLVAAKAGKTDKGIE